MGMIFSFFMIVFVVTMILPIGTFSSTGQEAHADQTNKGINYKVTLSETIGIKDMLATKLDKDKITEDIKSVEGINYNVKINDSVGVSETIK